MTSKTLTRADLSEAVHRQIGLSRSESADLVKSMLDLVSDTLVAGKTVKLSSFSGRRRSFFSTIRPIEIRPMTGGVKAKPLSIKISLLS